MEIKSASEMRKTHEADFEKACASVMRQIERASADGYRDTCFNPYPISQYWAVREEFEKHGYTFKRTGIIGGVRQTTEQICW